MFDDEKLRAKLAKVEALFRRAGSPAERAAAREAMNRLQGRLGGPARDRDPEVELRFSLPDTWSVSLFVAVCRAHGIRPYRYKRQRHTTVMVRTRERAFDRLVWPEYSRLQTELQVCFEEVTDYLVGRVMGSDGSSLDRG